MKHYRIVYSHTSGGTDLYVIERLGSFLFFWKTWNAIEGFLSLKNANHMLDMLKNPVVREEQF